MRDPRTFLWSSSVTLVFAAGCVTQPVHFEEPARLRHETTLPHRAALYLASAARHDERVVHAWKAGVFRRWSIPLGQVVLHHASAELLSAFQGGRVSEDGAIGAEDDLVVEVFVRDFEVRDFQPRLQVEARATDRSGAVVAAAVGRGVGKAGAGRIAFEGGAAMATVLRQGTDEAVSQAMAEVLDGLRPSLERP
ncbi:MAG: hypothetical protein HY722_15260 [Planctomycetes bacterium]|nr:hypothetical protein [Planctomycetota bacterium]